MQHCKRAQWDTPKRRMVGQLDKLSGLDHRAGARARGALPRQARRCALQDAVLLQGTRALHIS